MYSPLYPSRWNIIYLDENPKLLWNDPEGLTEIATYEVRYYAPAHEQVPVLNIGPEAEHMSDFIVTTWVFVQSLVRMNKLRESEERRRS